jgi:hypothetical protein
MLLFHSFISNYLYFQFYDLRSGLDTRCRKKQHCLGATKKPLEMDILLGKFVHVERKIEVFIIFIKWAYVIYAR